MSDETVTGTTTGEETSTAADTTQEAAAMISIIYAAHLPNLI